MRGCVPKEPPRGSRVWEGDGTGKGLLRTARVWERMWGGMGVMADLTVTSARVMRDVGFLEFRVALYTVLRLVKRI